MSTILDHVDDRLGELTECIDGQRELVTKIAKLLPELERLALKLQDDAEALMIAIDNEKQAAAAA
jgi:hypothetical protein